jgi:hypothetical protein
MADQLGRNDAAPQAAEDQPGREHGGCHAASRTVGERRDRGRIREHVPSLRPSHESLMKSI